MKKNTTTGAPGKRPPSKRQKSTEQENMEAAIRVCAFLEGPIPHFVRDAVVDAIAGASARTGAPEPAVDPKQGYDLESLAYLFDVAWRIDLRAPGFTVTPLQALAAHISAVLNYPDTPARVYNALADAVSDMDAPPAFFNGTEYIEMCLRENTKSTRRKGGVR